MYADDAPMAADKTRNEFDLITGKVIGCSQTVSTDMGFGFVEKIYENALALELRGAGLNVEQQKPCFVRYRDEIVGTYVTDLIVEEVVILEIKAVAAIERVHVAQCINYLRATGLHVGLVINFGRPRLEWRRVVNRF